MDRVALSPEQVARDYGPQVSSLCRRMIADPERAEDAAQEAWIEILRGLPSFRGEAALSTWIYAVVRRSVLRHIKKEKVYSAFFLREFFRLRSDEGMDELDRIAVEDRDAWVRLRCADCMTGIMHCLDDEARFVYLLRVLTPLEYRDIGSILEKDEAAVRQSFSRSARRINRFLNGNCVLYNPEGSCSCKMREPLRHVDQAEEYRRVKEFSRGIFFLPQADRYQRLKNYWTGEQKKA